MQSFDAMLIIKILFILAGILIFSFGFFSNKKDKGRLKIKRCSKETFGHVSGFDDREKIIRQSKYTEYRNYNTMHRKKTITYYTPYIKFEDEEGNEYEIKYPYPIEKRLGNGQKIKVKYNPDNPYDFYVSGDRQIQVFSTQAMAAGILLFAFGIALIFNLFGL